jgi:hypothetical protein
MVGMRSGEVSESPAGRRAAINWRASSSNRKALDDKAAIVAGFCALAHAELAILGVLPIEYVQPISAAYMVPLVVYYGVRHRPTPESPIVFLWPALYGVHAILVVAGVPTRFWGNIPALDVFVPLVGYGLVAALAGHIYSRVALRRLAASPESSDGA